MASNDDYDCQEETKETPTEDIMTPVQHRKVLKKVPKRVKKDLSRSIKKRMMNSFTRNRNTSATSSVQKQSLRANNKALAINLEKTRQELRMAHEAVLDLRKENRELEIKLATLQRVAGLRDEEIETEVEMRLEKQLSALKGILSHIGSNLYDAGQNLSSALDQCITSRRSLSHGSSRPTSTGSTSVSISDSEADGYKRSVLSFPKASLNFVDEPATSGKSIYRKPDLCNDLGMSMIAEQSILVDDAVPMATVYPSDDDDSGSQGEKESTSQINKQSNGTKKKTISKLPQRVLVKNKEQKDSVMNSKNRIDEDDAKSIGNGEQGKPSTEADHGVEKACVSNQKDTSVDRRKTFVVPSPLKSKQNEKSQDASKDRRGTFVVPRTESCEENEEEQTMYFNSDMEMTEIISQQISVFGDSKESTDKSQGKTEAEETGEPNGKGEASQGENLLRKWEKFKATMSFDGKNSNAGKGSNSEIGEGGEASSKSAFEFRLPKPGKIVFAASRKQIDGTRKPVPLKLTKKPRSKSTVRLTKEKRAAESLTTPSKPSSVFDFHDQTPKIAPDQAASVYDLSLNESCRGQDIKSSQATGGNDKKENSKKGRQEQVSSVKSKNDTDQGSRRSGTESKNSKKGRSSEENIAKTISSPGMDGTANKDQKAKPDYKLLSDSPVYYRPLKTDSPAGEQRRGRPRSRMNYCEGTSDEESEEMKSRSRSRSRRRTKGNDEEEDVLKTKRSKSRGRSRSKVSRSNQEDGPSVDGNKDVYLRTRSKSRGRAVKRSSTVSKETECEEIKDDMQKPREEDIRRKSRRSKSRAREILQDQCPEKFSNKQDSRGRSKTRKRDGNEQEMNDQEMNDQDNRRGRSKTRKRNDIEQEVDDQENRKGRSKTRKRDDIEQEVDDQDNRKGRSKTRKRDDIEQEMDDQENGRGRSKIRRRGAKDQEIDDEQKEGRPRSRMNYCEEQSDEDTEGQKMNRKEKEVIEDQVKNLTRSKSRRRSVKNVEEQKSGLEEILQQKRPSHQHLSDDENQLGSTEKSETEIPKSNVSDTKQSKKGSETKEGKRNSKVICLDDKDKESQSNEQVESVNKESQHVESNKSEGSENMVHVTKRSRSSKYVPPPDPDDDITFSDFDKLYQKVQQYNLEQDIRSKQSQELTDDKTEKEKIDKMSQGEQSKSFKTPAKPGDGDKKTQKGKKSTKKRRRSSMGGNQEKENVQSQSSSKKDKKLEDRKSHNEIDVSDTRAKLLSLQKRLTMSTARQSSESASGNVLDSKENTSILGDHGDRTSNQFNACTPGQDGLSDEPDSKRSRRGAAKVSYKEVPLNCKLRRGDPLFNKV